VIVVSELLLPEALALLRAEGPVLYDPTLWRRPDDLRQALAVARAWVVRNQSPVTRPFLDAAPALSVVGRLGAGLDNIDTTELERRGIALCLARGANALAVAEWVLAYLFHVTKDLAAADAHVRAGGWDRARFGGEEVAGKTLAIVGLGDIGRRLALRAHALGLHLVAHDPFVSPHDPLVQDLGIELAPLRDGLATADFVSVNVPLTRATLGLIGRAELARMKPSAHLIHTARGGVVDEDALYEALAAGRIAGCLLDVRRDEPPPQPDRFAALPNCVLTPHVAGLSREARRRVDLGVARAVLAALAQAGPGRRASGTMTGNNVRNLEGGPAVAIAVGAKAPDFELPATNEAGKVRLSDYRGRPVVILFYPFDFSGTCTTELCQVRDGFAEFGRLDADVVAISVDSIFSHRAWAKQEGFPFPLASDFDKTTAEAYGVLYQGEGGRRGFAKRSAFVVDGDGVVRYAWVSDDPAQIPDFEEIRRVLEGLAAHR
jgi:phosphoglycerate dehydrogenase-like enzyme/peroxiredoxin